MLEVKLLGINIAGLGDMYVYLLHDEGSSLYGVVDPADADLVIKNLGKNNLAKIFITHHHADHTAGIDKLVSNYGCEVIAPSYEADRISNVSSTVSEGDKVSLGESEAEVIFVPGHTNGHIAFYFREAEKLFCGDALFSLGCGRLYEGDALSMWESLCKLRSLPSAAKGYCGHEYTYNNAQFALSIDEDNEFLQKRIVELEGLRRQKLPTLPFILEDELKGNIFLRSDDAKIASKLSMSGRAAHEVFLALRRMKDNF